MPGQIVIMPFGKHRGQTLDQVDSGYLTWCVRECTTIDADLLDAIKAELARRRSLGRERDDDPRARSQGQGQGQSQTQARAPLPVPPSATPSAHDRAAVFDLLAHALAAGVRLIARGNGAIHCYGAVNPDLRVRLARHYHHLDFLSGWVAWEAPGRPRHTPATALLARLRRETPGARTMQYEQALKHGAKVGASRAEGDSMLALTCATLAAVHAINPRLVYDGARDKMQRAIGRLPQGYYNWQAAGEWREVTPDELQTLKDAKIKGITQSRWNDDLRRYLLW